MSLLFSPNRCLAYWFVWSILSCTAFWIPEEEGSLSQPVSKTAKNREATAELLFIS